MSPRAFLLAACAAAGLSSYEAEALTPLALDAAIDPQALEEVSSHARLSPEAFDRRPDAEYEPTAHVANARAGLQCVPFVRQETGVEIYGDASTWWAQARGRYERARAPAEEAVMVLRGYASEARGHVAVVKEIVSERLMVVDHANWMNAGEVTRDVPVRDVSPRNDWSQVQVWNISTGQWGGRTYQVQGFILNRMTEARAQTTSAG